MQLKSFVQLQNNAAGTAYQASSAVRESIAALIRGSDWQIFTDSDGSLRWDIVRSFSRFAAHVVERDRQIRRIPLELARQSSPDYPAGHRRYP